LALGALSAVRGPTNSLELEPLGAEPAVDAPEALQAGAPMTSGDTILRHDLVAHFMPLTRAATNRSIVAIALTTSWLRSVPGAQLVPTTP